EEFTDIPGRFGSHAVDGSDKIAVGHGVSALFELPQIVGVSFGGGRRDEDYLGSVQAERAGALGEMAIVADIDTYTSVPGLKGRKTQIAGSEIELFPETRKAMRDVGLAVLAEVSSVGIYYCCSVVIDSRHFLFVNRHDRHHLMLFGQVA